MSGGSVPSNENEGEDGGSAPRRAGAIWSTEDTVTLLAGLRAGETLEELAARLERRPSAIQARCKRMLPPELQASVLRAESVPVLQDLLVSDPDFDAEANLDRNTGRKWNVERIGIVTAGWHARRPLADLVEAVGASEVEIATRLIQLGLAADSLAVAERLGCTPGGPLDLRCRMMRDRSAASVWVLVVDGLPQGRHVSLHATRDDAHAHFTSLTGDSSSSAVDGEVTATVAERAVGSPYGPVDTLRPA